METNKNLSAEEFLNKVNNFITNNITFITRLKYRWLDEKEYEDFHEYQKVITEKFKEAGLILHSISKSFTMKLLNGETSLVEIIVNSSGRIKITSYQNPRLGNRQNNL